MSYKDPYAAQHNNQHDFDPYASQQQYPSYGQSGSYYMDNSGGYRDEPGRQPQNNLDNVGRTKEADEVSGFDRGEFNSSKKGSGSARSIRAFRRDHQGNLWTEGGKARCMGRFCCCTIMIALFFIISIALALALWIRPPSVLIGPAKTASGTSAGTFQGTGLTIPLTVNISVNNPNYFSVKLKQLKAEFTYPKGNVPIGSGVLNDVTFEANSDKNVTFPFQINYKFADDPSLQALLDIADRCGITDNSKSNLDIQYKITIGLQILVVNVSPSISNTLSFACPFDQNTINQIKQQFGSILGGGGS